MSNDPTEYNPNSKDITDDPNFPTPKCGVCGVPWAGHMGIMGVCLWNKTLKEDLKDLREEIFQLTKERDEVRKTCCQLWHKEDSRLITVQELAEDQGWDCYKTKKKETP